VAQHATTVYVTHDQIEAMAMGDRIVVMSRAEVQQVGTPIDVYYNPANLFVAQFIGSPGMNLVKGKLSGGTVSMHGDNRYTVPGPWTAPLGAALGGSADVVTGFRPEAARVTSQGALSGEVYGTDMYGGHTVVHVNLNENEIVHIRSDRQSTYAIGTRVRFDLDPAMVRFFDPRTEKAVPNPAAGKREAK
jgi:multiple sugar transport system ATP-binding protein